MNGKTDVIAPLSGRVIEIRVRTGESIRSGQTVAVLEAMKMDNELTAEADGIVTAINVNEGDFVSFGTSLVTLE